MSKRDLSPDQAVHDIVAARDLIARQEVEIRRLTIRCVTAENAHVMHLDKCDICGKYEPATITRCAVTCDFEMELRILAADLRAALLEVERDAQRSEYEVSVVSQEKT